MANTHSSKSTYMEISQIHKHCKCCICNGVLPDSPNALQIPVTVTWDSPKWGNFLTGAKDQGVAFVCDTCISGYKHGITHVVHVVEFGAGNSVTYHPVTWDAFDKRYLLAHI